MKSIWEVPVERSKKQSIVFDDNIDVGDGGKEAMLLLDGLEKICQELDDGLKNMG